MWKAALLVIALAACGGGKKKEAAKPAEPTTTEPAGSGAAEPAGKPDKPAEKQPAGPSPEEMAKQAMTEQVETGKKLWTEKKCNTCHGDDGHGKGANPPVIGDKALPEKAPAKSKARKGIAFKTAKDVMSFVHDHMPPKKPKSLSDDESAALTAFALSENKVSFDKKIDADSAATINLR